MAINHALREAVVFAGGDGRFGYAAPTYKEGKRIAWDYLKRFSGVIPDVKPNEVELSLDVPNGSRLFLLGAEDPDSLRGPYWDGMVFDEYAHVHPRAFPEIIRPALASRQGWVLFLGTPFGRNHFYDLYERARRRGDFLVRCYRASESGVIPQEELDRAREDMTPEQYAQEFECSFEAALVGAYYARELEAARAQKRIRSVPWEPTGPAVETYWDLGIGDPTAIMFVQRMGRELHVIDYYENRGQALHAYAKVLRERPYLYGRHHLPHDAGNRELGAGKSLAEQLEALQVRPVTVYEKNDPIAGINQARLLFPRLWFDEDTCRSLLDALANYRADYDEKKKTFKDQPRHDWASHGADALRLFACTVKFGEDPQRPPNWKPKPSRIDWNPFTVLDAPRPGRRP